MSAPQPPTLTSRSSIADLGPKKLHAVLLLQPGGVGRVQGCMVNGCGLSARTATVMETLVHTCIRSMRQPATTAAVATLELDGGA